MSDPPGTQWLRDQTAAAQGQKMTQELPYGPLQFRQSRLLPQYDALGKTRPLGPGEAYQLPDGGFTSEETYTVQMPTGKWAVVPGLWLMNGVPHHVTDKQAAELAAHSGLDWAFTFGTLAEADNYATQREAIWERTPQSLDMTTRQPALWARRK